ncbi:hypothetical protein [Lentzea atacamensis]|uniref:hypothetical protein n=1 Tax=Lentzea atacamensis TaxID=531938 RepID=UPI0011BF94E1|nr:hypothetical protein [Lentzea atacamensis]
MTASAVHLAGYEIDLDLPLSGQAGSLRAEVAAAEVFVDAAADAVLAGDIGAFGRLDALKEHLELLRQRIAGISTS